MTRFALLIALLPSLLAAKPSNPPKPSRSTATAPLATGQATVRSTPVAVDTEDAPRKLAEAYLKALAGEGPEAARESLLGGATLNARLEVLENWAIMGREPAQREEGDLADVMANVDGLDKAGRDALTGIMGGGPAGVDPDGLATQEVSGAAAEQLLAPTRARAAAFLKSHPVFAYVFRVDRSVFWHPRNPVRKLLAETGSKGRYVLDFDLFRVAEIVGNKRRAFPLRVLRLRTDKLDTGFKVLPASDWNAE